VKTALSLVICTRNRAEQLRACLAAVAAIKSSRPWEVIVVDNGSSDRTQAVLEEARGALPVRMTVVLEPVPGIARARNRGWRAASGSIVAFTDDDCYPSTDFIDRIWECFDEAQEVGFVGGAVILHDLEDARVTTITRSERMDIRPGMFIAAGTLISANLALRRRVLEAIGGFDEAFAYGDGFSGGDVDLVARASAAGWRGLYEPELIVRHHHGRKPGPETNRVLRAYDLGRGAFYAKSALDPRMRRTYLAAWLTMTWGRIRRRQSLAPVVRELHGAARYLALRARLRFGRRRSAPG